MARVLILHDHTLTYGINEIELMVGEVVRAALTDPIKHHRPKTVRCVSHPEDLAGLNLGLYIIVDSLDGLMSEAARVMTEQKLIGTLDYWIGPPIRFKLTLMLTLRSGEAGGSYYSRSIRPHENSMTYAVERGEALIEEYRRRQRLTQPAVDPAMGADLKRHLVASTIEV